MYTTCATVLYTILVEWLGGLMQLKWLLNWLETNLASTLASSTLSGTLQLEVNNHYAPW
jgi:hypothetical protein